VGCGYAAGAFSFWSVLGLFLGNNLFLGNDNNGVVFTLGSVPRWYFLWGPFRGYISLRAINIRSRDPHGARIQDLLTD
jgi:hypothetical protein